MSTQLAPEDTLDGLPYVYDVRKQDNEDETWEGGCSCGFRTSGWPLKRIAEERMEQHAAEHLGEAEDSPELAAFMLSHGIAHEPTINRDPFGDNATPVREED